MLQFLPFGGRTLTADLVQGLSVPYAEAQKAKEHYGTAFAQLVDPRETIEVPGPSPGQKRAVGRELIAHIVEQRLDEMFGLVQSELQGRDLINNLGSWYCPDWWHGSDSGDSRISSANFCVSRAFRRPE